MASEHHDCSPDLMMLLSWTSRVLAIEHAVGLAALDISTRAYHVLAKAMTGEWTQIRLAEGCQIDKTTMVVTMDELEKAGLAERRPSQADRRVRIVAVTDKGRDVVRRGNEIVARIDAEVLNTLPEAEREALLSGLARLMAGRLANSAPCERPPRRREPNPSRTRSS